MLISKQFLKNKEHWIEITTKIQPTVIGDIKICWQMTIFGEILQMDKQKCLKT